ncbi:MAG: MATE family efflux transporter [Bacillota bacterium]
MFNRNVTPHGAPVDRSAGEKTAKRVAAAHTFRTAASVPGSNAEIRGRVIGLSLPVLTEMTLMALVSMVDLIQVGRLGPWAITSVGLSSQPMFVAMSVFISLNVGATALVARFTGGGRPEEATAVARQALLMATAIGATLAAIGWFGGRAILLAMGAGPDVIGPGSAYLRIVSLGLLFQGPEVSLSASLRGAGDTRTPMKANMVANLFNVVGNWILINGHLGFPRLEVVGAAIPTFLARVLSLAIVVWTVFGGGAAMALSLRDSFRPNPPLIRRILRIGLPAAGEQLVLRGGNLAFARIVSSLGTTVYAAHQVALSVEGLLFHPGQAFQAASTTLVGQGLGAGDPRLAERSGWQTCNIALAFSLFIAAGLFFFDRFVVLLYTDDPSVIGLSAACLRIIAVVQPLMITVLVLIGALRGAGDTQWAMIITFIGIWGMRVTGAYLLGLRAGLGLQGAWIGMALDMALRCILVLARFKAGRWKTAKV